MSLQKAMMTLQRMNEQIDGKDAPKEKKGELAVKSETVDPSSYVGALNQVLACAFASRLCSILSCPPSAIRRRPRHCDLSLPCQPRIRRPGSSHVRKPYTSALKKQPPTHAAGTTSQGSVNSWILRLCSKPCTHFPCHILLSCVQAH